MCAAVMGDWSRVHCAFSLLCVLLLLETGTSWPRQYSQPLMYPLPLKLAAALDFYLRRMFAIHTMYKGICKWRKKCGELEFEFLSLSLDLFVLADYTEQRTHASS